MIEIDGSLHSGSGTILRYATAFATLMGVPLHMTNIRAKRSKPGIRPQHLEALRACSLLCRGRLEGAELGAPEIKYWPGNVIRSGSFEFDIGTAGSTTMLALTLTPLALFARRPSHFVLKGGLFQDYAPTVFYLEKVLVPLLQRMGAELRVRIIRPGYVPKGQGLMALDVIPLSDTLQPLGMTKQGTVKAVMGMALASHLAKEKVVERMAHRSFQLLEDRGYSLEVDMIQDHTAVQRGACLLLWAETTAGCLLGADQAGRPGRRSEAIAEFVVASLLEDLQSGATTDRHLADQLILFAGLADGRTTYRIPRKTRHVEANLWLVRKFLGARAELEGDRILIEGIGLKSSKTRYHG